MTTFKNKPTLTLGIFCVSLLLKGKCPKRYSLNVNTSIFKTRYSLVFALFIVITSISFAQTTFTESAAAYNLNIGGGKDGGHGWGDYDLDGDFDLVVNTNGRGYLLRNDGGSFTDVTATLCSEITTGGLERTALFIDLNNDGYPDIVRNDSDFLKIYLQIPNADPTLIRFGLSNGTAANQTFDDPAFGGDFNSEGTGAIDFDGDGDLDIFVENHNYGIDILENDGNGFFTHATVKPPGYNVADPTTWPLGLVQDAVDGDYGAITDFNNDGWVDIVARKRSQVDLFTNLGGTFQDGVNIDDANNSNKGAVAFFDFDNDTDFDLFWTENGNNQIHRNNGDGTWTALGAATGIPTSYSGQIEGLSCADVDNDGDIDIYLGNGGTGTGQRSKLYLNQLTDTGTPMTFIDSGLTFNSRNEGSTFIDIDDDGDMDLYVNKNGVNNELWINNLGATPRGDHLYVDIQEDRDAFGLINSEQRFGIGATARLLDCAGNDLLGIREVNGGQGHGTMEAGRLHFGLPAGDNIEYVLEVAFARTTTGRVVIQRRITPSSFFNGSINLINVLPGDPSDGPSAIDDDITTAENTAVNFDPLADNGNGVDFDSGGNPISVISITQPIFGTAVLEVDGTITYTPPASFTGTTLFSYTIESGTALCTVTDEGTVNITVTSTNDSDGDGLLNSVDLDDDNDGILDSEECLFNVLWVTNGTASTEEQNTIDKLIALGYSVTVVDDSVGGDADNFAVTFVFEDANSSTAFANVANLTTTTNGVITSENALHDEILGAPSGGSSNTNIVNITNNTHPITSGLPLGNLDIGDASFHSSSLVSGTVLGLHPNGEVSMAVWEAGDAMDVGTAPGRRVIVPHANSNGGFNSTGEDLLVNAIIWTANITNSCDADGDGIINSLDLDSDNDGIYDAVEAGHSEVHTNGRVNGAVGTDGVPDAVQGPGQQNSGTINYTLADSDSDGNYDYQELDSDADGCNDVNEAGYTDDNDDGLLGPLPITIDINGLVTSGSNGYTNPADLDSNSINDFQELGPDSNSNSISDGCELDLELTKVVDNSSPNVGDTITFTLTLINNGPSQASGVQVQDVLPVGLANIVVTPSAGTYTIGTGIWDLNTIVSSGSTETLVITAEITPLCGTITNTAEIIASSITDLDSTPNNGG